MGSVQYLSDRSMENDKNQLMQSSNTQQREIREMSAEVVDSNPYRLILNFNTSMKTIFIFY